MPCLGRQHAIRHSTESLVHKLAVYRYKCNAFIVISKGIEILHRCSSLPFSNHINAISASMADTNQLHGLEYVIGYSSNDLRRLKKALTAVHRVDKESSEDGNRKLTLLGESLGKAIYYDACNQGDGWRCD